MNQWLHDAILYYNIFVILYFLSLNLSYLALLFSATRELYYYKRRRELSVCEADECVHMPGIAVLAPAHNEEPTIVESVRSALKLDYPDLEVIVINDGSTDRTLDVLKNEFKLVQASRAVEEKLPTTPVKGVYVSALDQRLVVIDKERGGKGDSLNAGINHARSRLFCSIDADTIIEKDALKKLVQAHFERDTKLVALGGIVRVANDSQVEDGRIVKPLLPKKPLAALQALEYIRNFLCGRAGWNPLNSILIISGAFGLFDRKTVIEAGGYRTDLVAEDMELVVRLHRYMREKKRKYRITFLPDPIAWTQVPEKAGILSAQRNRWQRGLMGTLFAHLGMMFNPRYGAVGMLAMPYYLFFELLGPFIEVTGYFAVILSYFLGILSVKFMLMFLALALLFGVLLSVFALLLGEWTQKPYDSPRDVAKLFFMTLLENVGYRQLNSLWRIKASFDYLFDKRSWGKMERKAFARP